MTWLDALRKNRKWGSSPRCLLLTDGTDKEVSDRLTRMVNIPNIQITPSDYWMPKGKPVLLQNGNWNLAPTKEAKLTEDPVFLPQKERNLLRDWWLAFPNRANVPNWDIASTCSIDGERGLLLVEAKANHEELKISGKPLKSGASPNSRKNHEQIGKAIEEARNELSRGTGYRWGISRDSHYQLSNRFAWAWEIASLGIPVVLVYLGFTNAIDLEVVGLTTFKDAAEWEECVLDHCRGILEQKAWGSRILVGKTPMIPLIRTF